MRIRPNSSNRYDRNVISDPLPIYKEDLRWGEPVAAPCTFVQYLWDQPTQTLRQFVGDAVGLFGAIEIAHTNGPFLLNRNYHVSSRVVAVGQSPKTEYLWFDTEASDIDGQQVAAFRMMLRFMKASSSEYAPVS